MERVIGRVLRARLAGAHACARLLALEEA